MVDVIPEGAATTYRVLGHEAVSPSLARFGLDYRGYILFLGTLEPRKNVDGLIRAYERLVRQLDITEKLVIVGKRGRFYEEIFDLVRQLKLGNRVIFTGYVSDTVKVDLYNGAVCFAYPSHYEGFGLPVLEALACGVPVITSNVSSLPEIIGDAGLLVDPTDDMQLADAIGRVLCDPVLRADLSAKGQQRASHFSWARCAQETLCVWERAAQA